MRRFVGGTGVLVSFGFHDLTREETMGNGCWKIIVLSKRILEINGVVLLSGTLQRGLCHLR